MSFAIFFIIYSRLKIAEKSCLSKIFGLFNSFCCQSFINLISQKLKTYTPLIWLRKNSAAYPGTPASTGFLVLLPL